MEKKSRIITRVAAAGVACALTLLAPAGAATAADRRPADATSPHRGSRPQAGDAGGPERGGPASRAPAGGDYHADYHADYSAGRGGAPVGPGDEVRDRRPDGPTFPDPRHRRSPLNWRR